MSGRAEREAASVAEAPAADAVRPLLEIRGPWLPNKGDALMLGAAVEALRDRFTLAAEGGLGLRRLPRDAGLDALRWGTVEAAHLSTEWMSPLRRARAHTDALVLALPDRARHALRVRDGRDVTALLDVSGFAYGDQWEPERMDRRAAYYEMLRGRGARLVMAPQAVGPFERPEVRRAARRLFGLFDRIWARDASSRHHLDALGLDPARLGLVPDISLLLPPAAPPPGDWGRRVCVVANARMMDRTDGAVSGRYKAFLAEALRHLRERGADPFLLLHEADDAALTAEISARAGGVETLDPPALEAKAILGASRAVLSSRYHALVGALSQAVPTIGTSWAHKYDALFRDYGCPEMLLSPAAPDEALRERLDVALESADGLRAGLAHAAATQARGVRAMWDEARRSLSGEPG